MCTKVEVRDTLIKHASALVMINPGTTPSLPEGSHVEAASTFGSTELS